MDIIIDIIIDIIAVIEAAVIEHAAVIGPACCCCLHQRGCSEVRLQRGCSEFRGVRIYHTSTGSQAKWWTVSSMATTSERRGGASCSRLYCREPLVCGHERFPSKPIHPGHGERCSGARCFGERCSGARCFCRERGRPGVGSSAGKEALLTAALI